MNFIKKKGCWVSKKQNYLMQGIVFASRLYCRISTTLEIFCEIFFYRYCLPSCAWHIFRKLVKKRVKLVWKLFGIQTVSKESENFWNK